MAHNHGMEGFTMRRISLVAARVLNKINMPYAKTALAKYNNDNDPAVKKEANSAQAATQTNVKQTKRKKGT